MTDFELGAVGDCIVTRPLARAATVCRDAARPSVDATPCSETSRRSSSTCGRSPARPTRLPATGRWHRRPAVAADLATIGFDLVGRANNHALDWGLEGMRESSRWLDQAGIVHAGVGENAGQARAPGLSGDDRRSGRAGLVHHHLPRDQRGIASPRCGAGPAGSGRPAADPDAAPACPSSCVWPQRAAKPRSGRRARR